MNDFEGKVVCAVRMNGHYIFKKIANHHKFPIFWNVNLSNDWFPILSFKDLLLTTSLSLPLIHDGLKNIWRIFIFANFHAQAHVLLSRSAHSCQCWYTYSILQKWSWCQLGALCPFAHQLSLAFPLSFSVKFIENSIVTCWRFLFYLRLWAKIEPHPSTFTEHPFLIVDLTRSPKEMVALHYEMKKLMQVNRKDRWNKARRLGQNWMFVGQMNTAPIKPEMLRLLSLFSSWLVSLTFSLDPLEKRSHFMVLGWTSYNQPF